MVASPRNRWLQVEPLGAITLVTFTIPDILDLEMIRELGDQLYSLADDQGRRIILNFRQVNRLSTALLGKVIMFHKKLKELGGRLALCCIAPHLREAIDLLRLPQLLSVYGEEREALEALEGT
jgi:anti-anti-sigma regulatory factor